MTFRRCEVMGILNVTPDSFSDGGRFDSIDRAMAHATRMIAEGADLLDIGGESSRPGADDVDAQTEGERVVPVIEAILEVHPSTRISIDTTKAQVAQAGLAAGALLINDISAGILDPEILDVAAEQGADICLMHMKGTPRTMQNSPHYDDVVFEVRTFLDSRVNAATRAGVELSRVIVDPGIGFGKTLEHNLELIRHIESFKKLGVRVLLGASRKSVIGAVTGRPVEQRLAGSLCVVAWAAAHNVDIIRVHDVAETIDVLKIWKALQG